MEGLSLLESADIVEARIELYPTPPVTLHAASGLSLALQDEDMIALCGQDVATLQSSQTTAYDDDVFHFFLFIMR